MPFLMENYDGVEHINIGTGSDLSICQVAELIKQVVNYKGKIVFDESKRDGTTRCYWMSQR